MKNNIALVAVAYNRIDSLSRLLSSLENAYYGDKKPTLIISIDKSETDAVEKYAEDYVWPYGNKIVKKHSQNLGLRTHMLSLGQWFDEFDSLVVLEDDIVVSPAFYNFTCQAVEKYYYDHQIAGISLYSFPVNYISGTPFSPVINEYDGYFMNCAMSWGEVWMKNQWLEFYQWYLDHQEFDNAPHLPSCLFQWKKSWLKYHIRYCIECNKYFLYPYVSLSTNFSDSGIHNKGGSTIYQSILQQGIKKYSFPDDETQAICYDGFFENKKILEALELKEDECCVDLYCMKQNRLFRKYWLTTQIVNLPIVKSYGVAYKPLEQNIFQNTPGSGIYLYKLTNVSFKLKRNSDILLYRYNVYDIVAFLRTFGFKNLFRAYFAKFKSKL